MRKLILMLLLMIPIATALEECLRENPVMNVPCVVYSTWKPVTGCEVIVNVYNESSDLVNYTNWQNSTVYCEFLFNQSGKQSYNYNSTIEDGVITNRDDTMTPLAILILLPLALGFAMLIGGISLGEKHPALKIALFLLVPIMFLSSFHIGATIVVEYYNFPVLQNVLASNTYYAGIIAFILVSYFAIYLLMVMFNTAAQKKKERLEY